MSINKSAQTVSIGGILTALAILFQSAPIFLPGMGLILSPLATLPVALATIRSSYLGIMVFLSSALVLILVNPQEAAIFIMTTGLLGLSLGISLNKRIVPSIAVCTIVLFIGIYLLKNAAGLAVFGSLTSDAPFLIEAALFALFALVYSVIWVFLVRFFAHILRNVCRLNEVSASEYEKEDQQL